MAVKRYNGTSWDTVAGLGAQGAAAQSSSITTWVKTAAGGETSLTGSSDSSTTLAYTPGQEQLFINGVLQVRDSDYTATNGTSITGISALIAGDVATVTTVNAFSVTGAVPLSTVTANGDLIVGTSSGAVGRLGVGSTGQLLTVAGGVPTWAAPVSGGMTLLSTTAITAVSQVSITGIDQTYNQLVIVMENAATTNTGVALQVRFNTNTTSGQYAYISRGIDGGAVSDFNSASAALIQTGLNISTTANTNSINTVFTIPRYTNTTRKSFTFNTAAISSTTSTQALFIGTGSFLGSAAISSVQFIVGAGTFTAQGNIYIYGVK